MAKNEQLMKSAKSKPKDKSFHAGVARAIRRAATRARETARMYGTPIYFWEYGRVVAKKP